MGEGGCGRRFYLPYRFPGLCAHQKCSPPSLFLFVSFGFSYSWNSSWATIDDRLQNEPASRNEAASSSQAASKSRQKQKGEGTRE